MMMLCSLFTSTDLQKSKGKGNTCNFAPHPGPQLALDPQIIPIVLQMPVDMARLCAAQHESGLGANREGSHCLYNPKICSSGSRRVAPFWPDSALQNHMQDILSPRGQWKHPLPSIESGTGQPSGILHQGIWKTSLVDEFRLPCQLLSHV